MSTTFTTGAAQTVAKNAAEEVITSMRQNPANWGNVFYESVQRTDQFLKVLSQAKTFFNEEQGDTHKFTILNITRPSESEIGNWTRVEKARPGYNPSQQSYNGEIRYGHKQITGTMLRHGVRTQWFNKLDLAMTPKRKEQINQVSTILGNYTRHIWELWSRRMFQKSVTCSIISSTYGTSKDQVGSYAQGILPTSILTYEWLNSFLPVIRAASRGFASAEEADKFTMAGDKQMVFMGYQEFNALLKEYKKVGVNQYGNRPDEVVIPGLDLTATPIDQFVFVLMPEPPRYRLPVGDETWEECLIPPTRPKTSGGGPVEGSEDEPNPDYLDPDIAVVSESFIVNLDAIKWLVPPSGMTGTLNGVAGHAFPATNYMGDFFPADFKSSENPKGDNVFYMADYMSGMVGLFPQRARSILSLAAHASATDVVLINTVKRAASIENYYIQKYDLNTDGNLVVLMAGTVPATPGGFKMVLESEFGERLDVTTRVSTTATAGTRDHAPGSTLVLTAGATDHREDPWRRVLFLPV